MDSLGHRFKTARESQGLTLEQVASTTRVREYYLKALEEDRFDRLPQKVFAKGFVRCYARSIGFDEADCARLFAERSASFYKKKEEERSRVLQRIEEDHKSKANRTTVLLTGVVVLGLLFFLSRAYIASITVSPESELAHDATIPLLERQGSSVSTRRATAEKTRVPERSASRAPAVELQPAAPVVSEQPGSLPEAGLEQFPLLLALHASELTWVVVRSDDGEPIEALLQPGEIAKWRAQDRFLLTLGNAGGVTAKLNGQTRGPFGDSGVVIRDIELRP